MWSTWKSFDANVRAFASPLHAGSVFIPMVAVMRPSQRRIKAKALQLCTFHVSEEGGKTSRLRIVIYLITMKLRSVCLLSVTTQISKTTGSILAKLSVITTVLKNWNKFKSFQQPLCAPPPFFSQKNLLGYLINSSFWLTNRIPYRIPKWSVPRFVKQSFSAWWVGIEKLL